MRLETKRLLLREWSKKDVNDLVEGLNELTIAKWLVFVPNPYTKKDAKEWITLCMKNARKGKKRDSYNFAIELQSEKKVIGGVDLNKINRFQGTAGGGIWINQKYQNKGYGTEAFRERIRFAFNTLKLRRLENGFLMGNTASRKMQEKLGYTVEGLRRKGFKCKADGKIKDEYTTALLKEDWKRKYGNS